MRQHHPTNRLLTRKGDGEDASSPPPPYPPTPVLHSTSEAQEYSPSKVSTPALRPNSMSVSSLHSKTVSDNPHRILSFIEKNRKSDEEHSFTHKGFSMWHETVSMYLSPTMIARDLSSPWVSKSIS